MPHRKWSRREVVVMGTRFTQAPDQDGAVSEVVQAVANNPAWREIADHLLSAHQLGFDPSDPDIIRRATTAGEADWSRNRLRGVHEHPHQRRRHVPVVYYARISHAVKIGTSTNLRDRMQAIVPEQVMAVEVGGRQIERQRHEQFASKLNHAREWFVLDEELRRHIADTRANFEDLVGEPFAAWLERWVLTSVA